MSAFESSCADQKVDLPFDIITKLYEVGEGEGEWGGAGLSVQPWSMRVPHPSSLPLGCRTAPPHHGMQDPLERLGLIADPHLRMRARACINRAVEEEYASTWAHCTDGEHHLAPAERSA